MAPRHNYYDRESRNKPQTTTCPSFPPPLTGFAFKFETRLVQGSYSIAKCEIQLGDAIGGWKERTRSSQWSEGKFQKMFLVPPGRKRANLLVGLNRQIIQTGWGIGDPLQFLLSFSLLHFAFCLRWLHRNYCIEVCHEEIGSEANVFPIQTPNRYTLSSYSRSVFVHSLTHSNLEVLILSGGNGGISSLDSPFFSLRASSNVRPSIFP